VIRRILILLAPLCLPLAAQDGAQLYGLYCGACHGADGNGATGGQFPPLAGSPWVAGEEERAIRIVLHGLHGPVDVKGRTYNLEMPPQGAMLPDDQIAAILTHVRSSWGNASPAVKPDRVAAIRTAQKQRRTPWTAEELLRDFPLPLEKSALSQLISRSYEWSQPAMPDFATLQALNTEEEHDGLLDAADAPRKDHFAMTWEGFFTAPADGSYEFLLDADDGAALHLDGKMIVEITGIGPADGSRSKIGRTDLKAGSIPFRAAYYEVAGQEVISAAWRLKGEKGWHWLSREHTGIRPALEPIPIAPENGRPVLYRNFITGTTPRAIGVGFPAGINLAYSADHLAPEILWTGDFLDGTGKWLERGTNPSPPAGENVVKCSSSPALPAAARFRGYELDAAGNPTFISTLGQQIIRDHFEATSSTLTRRLSLNSGPPVRLLVSDAFAWELTDDQTGTLGPLELHIEGAATVSQGKPCILELAPGTVTLTYRWK
jgi:mono/diheme cytochrome c family protein